MSPQIIVDIIGAVSPHLYWLFFKALIAFILFKILIDVVSNISSWFMFKMNDKINTGIKVQINGDIGIIEGYDLRFIYIKTELDDEILIPITKWKSLNWKIKNIEDSK